MPFFLNKRDAVQHECLPAYITPDRMARIALTELKTTPKLRECTPQSLAGAIMQCAKLGLEPGSGLGHSYLIPYGKEATLIIGYRGLMDLARRSGEIEKIVSRIVYAEDDFLYEFGLEERLEHVPSKDTNRGEPVFVYAIAQFKSGTTIFEVMSVEEINKIRDRAKYTGKGTPWSDFWGEMARKTVVRRLFKYLPATILPREAHDTLNQEDRRMYRDVKLQEVSQDLLAPGRHETKKKPEPEKIEEPSTEEEWPPDVPQDMPIGMDDLAPTDEEAEAIDALFEEK